MAMNSMDLETTYQQLKQQPRRASETQATSAAARYMRQSSKLHRKRKSSSKEKPWKGRCWNLSLVPLLLLPKSHASALHRCYDARTHARPPHFRRTRERARRRRPDRGKRCSLTKSFQRRRVTLRTDRLPQTPPDPGHALPTYSTPRGETYWLPTYQPTNLLLLSFTLPSFSFSGCTLNFWGGGGHQCPQ